MQQYKSVEDKIKTKNRMHEMGSLNKIKKKHLFSVDINRSSKTADRDNHEKYVLHTNRKAIFNWTGKNDINTV